MSIIDLNSKKKNGHPTVVMEQKSSGYFMIARYVRSYGIIHKKKYISTKDLNNIQ